MEGSKPGHTKELAALLVGDINRNFGSVEARHSGSLVQIDYSKTCALTPPVVSLTREHDFQFVGALGKVAEFRHESEVDQ